MRSSQVHPPEDLEEGTANLAVIRVCESGANLCAVHATQYAVKIMDLKKNVVADNKNSFTAEVNTLIAMSEHPNIVSFYGALESKSNLYLILQLCEGDGTNLLALDSEYPNGVTGS